MSICKYCGRQLTFTSEVDGVCYVCQTYGQPAKSFVASNTSSQVVQLDDTTWAVKGENGWYISKIGDKL